MEKKFFLWLVLEPIPFQVPLHNNEWTLSGEVEGRAEEELNKVRKSRGWCYSKLPQVLGVSLQVVFIKQ